MVVVVMVCQGVGVMVEWGVIGSGLLVVVVIPFVGAQLLPHCLGHLPMVDSLSFDPPRPPSWSSSPGRSWGGGRPGEGLGG